MGLVIMRFVTYFAQMGVGAALVQKPELTHDDVRAGFTSSMLLGVAACLVVVAAAPLATILFPHPQVVPVVRVMAIDFVLNGATITSFALLRRRLAFKALAVADTLTYIVGYGAVSIVLAALGFGVWSLVIGALAQGALTVVAYYALTLHSVKPLFRWSVYRTLYSYGARISVIQFLEFFTYNMDTMWAGHFFSTAELGIYTRSFTLVSLPNQYVATSFTRVLFPAFSRIQTERERLKNAYLPAITVAAIIGVPLMWGIAAASPQVVLTDPGRQVARRHTDRRHPRDSDAVHPPRQLLRHRLRRDGAPQRQDRDQVESDRPRPLLLRRADPIRHRRRRHRLRARSGLCGVRLPVRAQRHLPRRPA